MLRLFPAESDLSRDCFFWFPETGRIPSPPLPRPRDLPKKGQVSTKPVSNPQGLHTSCLLLLAGTQASPFRALLMAE